MKFYATVLGFLACLAGCASKDSNQYGTIAEFCAAWGKAACSDTVVSRCSGMTASAALTASCSTKQQAFCESIVPVQGYSSAQASKCLLAVGNAYSDGTLSATEVSTVRHLGDPCNHLIKGPVAKGGACLVDDDCDTVDDQQCVQKNGLGTCVVPMLVANGTSCVAPEAACQPGFYCGDGNCIQEKPMAAKCAADYECATGLQCAGLAAADATSGQCTARVSQRACSKDDDCTTNVCDIATGAESGLCVDMVTLAPTEGICDDLR
jgi:hypothetical protein